MEYLLLKGSLSLIEKIEREKAFKIGKNISKLAYNLPRIKKITELNLLFTGYPKEIGRESLKNFVVCAIDFFKSTKYTENFLEKLVVSPPLHKIPTGGGIFLTAHIGNWELMGAYFSVKSNGKLSVVAKPIKNRKVNTLINSIRKKWKIKVIETGKILEMLKDLKRGKYLGILLDQRPKVKEGVLTTFLGKETYTNKGAAVLSKKTGKPVIPAFCFLTSENRYTIKIGKPIYPNGKTIEELTQAYTLEIEKAVRSHPEQWFWFHNRWKNSPQFKKFLSQL